MNQPSDPHPPSQLPPKETLTVEFKSDRERLPDRELVESLVGLANASGGELFLGVEEDGTPTGLHKIHLNLEGLPAMVANMTRPPLHVQVEAMDIGGMPLARIHLARSRHLVSAHCLARTQGRIACPHRHRWRLAR